MLAQEMTETTGIKQCHACGAELLERDKFCRRRLVGQGVPTSTLTGVIDGTGDEAGSFFAVAMLFSMSGFYEIIELWDERYFHGKRIWSPHDTANDLQWNLIGAVIGVALSYAVLKK